MDDKTFLEAAKDEIAEAWIQIDEHKVDGEDNFLSIVEAFPHGIPDLTYMIFSKARRVVGYEMQGNFRKVRVELQDIINYSAFALAFLRIEPEIDEAERIVHIIEDGIKQALSEIKPRDVTHTP